MESPGNPQLPKDSRARRIGQLEERMDIVVEGAIQILLALEALAIVLKAPKSYHDQLDSLAEQLYRATITPPATAQSSADGGDGEGPPDAT